jgi:hypothetical protein
MSQLPGGPVIGLGVIVRFAAGWIKALRVIRGYSLGSRVPV